MGWWNKLVRDRREKQIDLGEKFQDANTTSELVISGTVNTGKTEYKQNLDEMTKQQLIEFAESEIGITIDRRLTKSLMIQKIIEETP